MPAVKKAQKQNEIENGVIYARFSSHGQQEQSIDGQLRDCYTFAEREGIRVVAKYVDKALSGKTDNRRDFQRMIKDATKKQFKYIVVWKLDRFARNRYDSAFYKNLLKKHGVKVISAMENIGDTPEGIILEGMLESMAEYYSENLAQNVKRGQRESILKGSHVGGLPPFGFKSVKSGDGYKLVADEEKAPIIKHVFEQYAKGVTKKKIIEELTAKGISNNNGNTLKLSSLQTALRNTKYIGKYMYGGEEVVGACEALIDEDTFYKVQDMLNKRSHGKTGEKARQEYLLQGKAFCGLCGSRLVGDAGTSRHGNVYFYYACGERKKRKGCKKLNEKKAYLEWFVVEQTVEYVLQPERMEYIASRIVEKYEEEFNDITIKDYERQLVKIQKEAEAAVDASIKAPEAARQIYYDKLELLMTQKADIENELVTLRIANGNRYTQEQIVAWLKVFTRGDLMDKEFQRRIIDVFINSVYVYDDKIVIYYNVKDGKQVSYMEMINRKEEPPYGGDSDLCNGTMPVDKGIVEGVKGSDIEPTTP